MTTAQGYFIISALFAIVSALYKNYGKECMRWWNLSLIFFILGCFFSFYK